MKKYLIGIWYSMPVQLLLLHFRKYQVFLIFWYILFATVAGKFMENFGADSLFLAPEYYNKVNILSTAFVGFAIAVFIMSWNITTFILHNKYFKFLATTAQPFLKFCINNSILPFCFLLFYFFNAIDYDANKQLMSTGQIVLLVSGFLEGFLLAIFIAFAYFFSADKTIYYAMSADIQFANKRYKEVVQKKHLPKEKLDVKINWFLSAKLGLRKPRDVRHYSESFLESIFKRHHIAAVIAFFIAFIILVVIGFISDTKLFQIPAAASITIFFALIIAVVGALSLFLKNWSILVVLLLYVVLNFLYEKNIIDPRNKAYGLNYTNKNQRPEYTRENILTIASNENIQADKQFFLQRLNAWKQKQKTDKPVMYIINTSGGGLRSATFTFSTLQHLDSLMDGQLMQKTVFINGASGGMLGAAYFRELYLQKLKGKQINLQNSQYINDVSTDLLNPLFSSFVSRDIIGPVQKFWFGNYEYVKDRGYAFEQKLASNTNKILNKTLQDYLIDEQQANIPTTFFNSVITRDGRKLIMCTQPVRFLTKAVEDSNKISSTDPDAIDFVSFFKNQNATGISILSALRMNATFPYVLPNVWLPSSPVIDVMDAGFRDNFGQENTLRFLETFKTWIKENTSKVVIIQIRDRAVSDWDKPYESKNLISMVTKPAFLLQYNWFKIQDYYQQDALQYLSKSFGNNFQKITFQYIPAQKESTASLSFHLTQKEKQEILQAVNTQINKESFKQIKMLQ